MKYEVDIFLKGDLPAGFKNLSTSAEELLQEFKEYANGKINYKLISPDDQMPGTTQNILLIHFHRSELFQ